ncbi:MAG: aminotransferase class V-fold PLP-dependent enzyme [Gammaproteobacteria bacterium]|nr:aminotransferase class V-fold PLP-dependent enzyme [Gammaproteobacteria bacterium]NIM74496.1 aminotransferase class V-fold PLP-dependent enzyme [Gammaproteobacteria bacterium]NIO26329.1 aminotransferase class V-fold PLP-dependent enzyme [Gammaproteobacteria bacterium]NIO66881.1 aminotransferase class V-fold PLP-dependent enzyme [Gammaproteobacteria bacterium]NIP66090.1 aminotransferase class V-fold PLP-dependent enzyme [Gammaproteobacteria bacterium]
MISSQRHLFDIPADIAYFNCAYLGPLSNAVVAAGRQAAGRKAHPWEISSEDFFTDTEIARGLFAKLINAEQQDVAIVPAASYGVAVAASNLPLDRNQSVVLLAEQFPSNVYAWRESAARAGARVVTVERPGDGDLTRAVLDAMDERTAIVALPNCHWADGALLDLERIGAACRTLGAGLVLDVTQSAGVMPLDVRAIEPDFLVAACYKWLLGPYSTGFLYVAPHRQGGTPLEYSWRARIGSEDFAGLVNYQDRFQPGALRFDVGECANFHTMPAVVAALEQILDWDPALIAETLAARNAGIAERAAALGLESLDAAQRAGHFLGLRFPRGVADGLLDALKRQGVYLSVRGDSLRITPHLYNDDADEDRLMHALERAIA